METWSAENSAHEDGLTTSSPRPVTALLISELERAYLAEIIHDDVLQTLGASLLTAETCVEAWRNGRSQLLGEQLETLRRMLEQSITSLRCLMRDLRPYQPAKGGLQGALQALFRTSLERGGSSITFARDGDEPLGSAAETLVYRLIVESLLAVQRLDEPYRVHIVLRGSSPDLELELHFARLGGGVPPAELFSPRRLALLRWRVRVLGGSLLQEDEGSPNVRLRLRVPVPV